MEQQEQQVMVTHYGSLKCIRNEEFELSMGVVINFFRWEFLNVISQDH